MSQPLSLQRLELTCFNVFKDFLSFLLCFLSSEVKLIPVKWQEHNAYYLLSFVRLTAFCVWICTLAFDRAWHNNRFLFIPMEQTLLTLLSRPKMADVLAPFCASFLCFGRQNLSLVCNQRQLVGAMFAGICACTSMREAATSLHRDSLLVWAQFFGKNGNEFLAQNRTPLFFFSSFDHMLESQEASELFVELFHITACLLSDAWLLFIVCLLIYF